MVLDFGLLEEGGESGGLGFGARGVFEEEVDLGGVVFDVEEGTSLMLMMPRYSLCC